MAYEQEKGMVELAGRADSWSVEYVWSNPTTKVLKPKSSYVKRIEDVVICVGIYK